MFWLQRSRIKWLREGDQNNSFFHNTTIQKRQRNKILRLKNSDGVWMEMEVEISSVITGYFQNLYKSKCLEDVDHALDDIFLIISEENNCELLSPISKEEIHEAVFQLRALKALSPDGFSRIFYQQYRSIMGDSVCHTIMSFFNSNQLHPSILL